MGIDNVGGRGSCQKQADSRGVRSVERNEVRTGLSNEAREPPHSFRKTSILHPNSPRDVAQTPSKVKGHAAGKSFVFRKIFAPPETGKETLLSASARLISAQIGYEEWLGKSAAPAD